MDTTEIIFALSIAIIYPCFFNKFTNQIIGYDVIENGCNIPYTQKPTEEQWTKYENCKSNKDNIILHKHLMLLAIALMGIILSSVIQTKSTKLGIGLGGIFTLLFALFMYWNKYKEITKLGVLGVSLLLVIYLSVKLYRVNNIADIFTFEFGTK